LVDIEIVVIFRRRVGGVSEAALERFLVRAKRQAGLRGVVNVLVTSSRELRALNRSFLGKDRATDVLSFPPAPGFAADFAGDVAISGEIAAQNAKRLGHMPAEEVKILCLHGVLHLAGYDHEHDRGQMARREQRLRKSLGLPPGLIERNVPPVRSKVAGKRTSMHSAGRRAAQRESAVAPRRKR
jgi:probable rRNA maturation factor